MRYYETVQAAFIDVTLSTAFSCAGIQGTLCYDNTLLSFEEATEQADDSGTQSFRVDGAGVRFILLGDVVSGTSGEWLTATFRVIKQGDISTAFSLSDTKYCSLSAVGAPFSCNAVSGKAEWITGDVNRDGVVDIKDLIRIRRYFSGQLNEDEYSPLNANCNGDELLDANDMTSLRSILLRVF